MPTPTDRRYQSGLIKGWICIGAGLVLEFAGTVMVTSPSVNADTFAKVLNGEQVGPGKALLTFNALLVQLGTGLFYLGLVMVGIVFALRLFTAVFRPGTISNDPL